MKLIYGVLILIFLLSPAITLGQEENNSVFDRKLELETYQKNIAAILEQISAQLHVFFSYDATLIDLEKKPNIVTSQKPLREILDELLGPGFDYKAIGDQIVITRINQKENETENSRSKTIIFKGKVIDREDESTLTYASIVVPKRNLGTITNIDGKFELKIPESMHQDSVVISCLGYQPQRMPIANIDSTTTIIRLHPVSVQLREVKITAINASAIISKMISRIRLNYPVDEEIMTAFYREILRQDNQYIDVAEALLEIRKSTYNNNLSEDKIKFIKGRKNLNVKPFSIVDFKIQGGPYYATKLDIVKTLESFLDQNYHDSYKYMLEEIVEYNNRDTYVIFFKPSEKFNDLSYQGRLYIDMSTLALVHADFSLSRQGLKFAHRLMIMKKPRDFFVRPTNADYSVTYRREQNKWHLNNAQTSVTFKVRSKMDRVNSDFHSNSELLITEFKPVENERFKRNELINSKDIFTEMITSYDENFWSDYNIILPSEDLRNTLREYSQKNDSLFRLNPELQSHPNN